MIRIKKLDHVVLRAKDAEKLVDFYCTVLGCTVERKIDSGIHITQLRAGDALIDILAIPNRSGGGNSENGSDGRNLDHFCVRLEIFEEAAIRAHLARHGIEGSKLESRYGSDGFGPSIYIQDPEGNTVELKG
jgi:glyoxylase I family protein